MSDIKVQCPQCQNLTKYEPTGNESCDDMIGFYCEKCGRDFEGHVIITMEIKT